ncbi:hypothetical protein BH11ARM2_BH11ARM2_38540 [soil metagenome]
MLSTAALAQDAKKVEAIEKRLAAVSTQFAEVSAEQKGVPTDEHLQKLQAILDELKALRKELAALKGTSTPSINSPGSRTKLYGYVQFQFTDEDRAGSNDGFRLRRVRLRLDHTLSPRLELRTAYDFAGGTNNNTAELKDAYAFFRMGPSGKVDDTDLYAGQWYWPLGNDIIKGQSDYEFGERAIYNNTQFAGYRTRGAWVDQKIAHNISLSGGAFDSLSVNDPEQRNKASAPDGKIVGYAGLRYHDAKNDVGLTGISGERPDYDPGNGKVVTSTVRKYIYLSGGTQLSKNLFLRGEGMLGRDRIAGSTVQGPNEQLGYYGILSLKLPKRDDLNFRYQYWDRDRNNDGDHVSGYGLSYRHTLSDAAMLMFAYERFYENVRQGTADRHPYGQLTVRLQVKF